MAMKWYYKMLAIEKILNCNTLTFFLHLKLNVWPAHDFEFDMPALNGFKIAMFKVHLHLLFPYYFS